MRALRALFHRLRGLFPNRTAGDEITAELDSHLQLHIDDNLHSGMSPAEARRQALLKLGGLEQTRQAVRERSTLPWVETLAQDLRFALRQLRKAPGFTAVVIVTLALGIGVNTALFSIVNTVLLHPIDSPRPGELLAVDASKPNFETGSISFPNYLDWKRDNRSFSALAIFRHVGFVMTGSGESERVRGNYVTSNLFPLLGVKPSLGRMFSEDEDQIGRDPVVMLGGGFWARKFGSDPKIIGQSITLNGRGYTVIGIIPADFDLRFGGFLPEDVYVPIGAWETEALRNRGAGLGIHGIARLKPGVTLAQARADMHNVTAHLAEVYPQEDRGLHASLRPLRESIIGNVRPVLVVLLGAVGFVLLIACSNVANLLLARSSSRAQEFGVRLALGASRRRIVRQILTESIILAFAGGVLALALAAWGTHAAVALAPDTLPRAAHIHLSPIVLAFTFAVSFAVGILFGLIPAWKIAAQQPHSTLRDSGSRTVHGSRQRTQDALVIFQMAAALVLLAGAGLMVRSLFALYHTSPGFDPSGILRFSVAGPDTPAIDTPQGARAYARRLDEQVLSVPGASAVSLMDGDLPLTGDDDEELFWMQNEPKPANANEMHWSLLYLVEPGYLPVMRIPLLRGRWFTEVDREDTPRVIVIDEDLARQFFPNSDPIGKVVNLTNPDNTQATIVGVVGHVLHWGLDNDAGSPLHAQLYQSMDQLPDSEFISTTGFFYNIAVRADHPDTVFPDIQSSLREMNASQVAWRPLTMNQIIAGSLAARRFSMILLAAFAALALLLASVGLYGVISYLVGQRTQEMAIRMALGASRGDVLRWVLRRGTLLAIVGIGAGTLAALLVTRAMARISIARSSMIYGVHSWDPVTLLGVIAVLLCVALLASYIPARRAASVDPMQALRSE